MLELLNHLFSVLCGQNPDHTWMPAGIPLPCCQRCLGLYAGAAMALTLHLLLRPAPSSRFLKAHAAFLVALLPFGFPWMPQSPATRTVSGVLYGFGVVAFLSLPCLTRSVFARLDEAWNAGRVFGRLPARQRIQFYYAALVFSAVLLPMIAHRQERLAAFLLTLLICCGAAGLGLLVLANLALGFIGAVRLCVSFPRSLARR